jgi:hypothetical protein
MDKESLKADLKQGDNRVFAHLLKRFTVIILLSKTQHRTQAARIISNQLWGSNQD